MGLTLRGSLFDPGVVTSRVGELHGTCGIIRHHGRVSAHGAV